PLMPLIFLMSAVVSGIALLLVLYIVIWKVRGAVLDRDCLNSLMGWLIGFLLVDVTLELLEIISMMYEWEESWEVIYHLLSHKLKYTFFFIQMGLGAVLPLFLLTIARAVKSRLSVKTVFAAVSGMSVLVGVLAMRVNVVIGGQLFSKSLRGFVHFVPPFLGREGILILSVVSLIPFVLMAVICILLPPWGEEKEEEKAYPLTS
ncbi:MAG: polysulfide reductase NrfD, partial [bacterium]|nr:polysulfide reductase NrfD [bacterium]